MIAELPDSLSFSLASLEALWRHTSDLIIEYDSKLQVVSVNPAASSFLQTELLKKQVLGEGNSSLFGEQVGSELDQALKAVQNGQESRLIECQISTSSGSKCIFEVLMVLAWKETGELSRLIALYRDITIKRNRYQELADQLEQQKNFLLNVINTSPNPIFVKNSRGEYTLVNQATCDIAGRTMGEMIGKTDLELATENSLQFRNQDLEVIRSEQALLAFEEIIVHPNGEKRWYHTTKRFLKDTFTKEPLILGNAVDITQIKIAEETSRKSESLLRSLISNAPIIVCAIDRHGTFTLSEGRGLKQLNLEPGEVVGESVFDLYKDYPEVLETIRDVINKKIEFAGVFHVQGRVYETTYTPLPAPEGGLICVAYDITERHNAESDLKFTQFSIDKSGEAAFWIDSFGDIIYVNDRAAQMSGYSKEELLKKSVFEISPSRHSDRWNLNWKFLKKVQSMVSEAELISKDGKIIPIEVSQNFIQFDDQEFNCAFVKDITERRKSERAIHESERRFRTMANSSPSLIAMFDHEGNCEYANTTLLEFTGFQEKEIIGKGWLQCIHPEDRHYLGSFFDPANDSQLQKINVECRVMSKESGARWLLVQGSRRRDESQKPMGYIISAIDITERKQSVEALRKAAKELERSNRELEQFAYVASHDLQEPLRMISGFCELLHDQYHSKLDAQADEYLAFIQDGAQRMSHLIRDLLLYSRSSQRGMQMEYVDVWKVVDMVRRNLRLAIEETGAEILAENLPRVWANRHQLVQLFQNLIDNSLKYRHPERAPKIRIQAQLKDDEYLFTISDNGRGFEMKFKDKIFQIFQRLEKRSAVSGSGIGLAIAKKIVESAGGSIWVESVPNEGTKFFFTCPIQAGNSDEG